MKVIQYFQFLYFLLLAACSSQLPVPGMHTATIQPVWISSEHWRQYADQLIDFTKDHIEKNIHLKNKEIYISCVDIVDPMDIPRQPWEHTAFGEGFRSLMISRFVQSGFHVSGKQNKNLSISVQGQIIHLPSNNAFDSRASFNFPWTVAASSSIILPPLVDSGIVEPLLLPGALAQDIWGHQTINDTPPNEEILMTARLIDGDKIIAAHDKSFYVNSPSHFMPTIAKLKNWEVKGQ